MNIAGSDGIDGLNDFPFFVGIGHGALDDFPIEIFKAAEAPRGSQRIKAMTAGPRGEGGIGRGKTGRRKSGFFADGAMTIDAIDFDGGARFAVNLSIAMIILIEMAIGTLHSFFEVNVGEMDSLAEAIGIVEGNDFVVGVEPVPFSVVFVDAAKDPAVAMEVGELCCL